MNLNHQQKVRLGTCAWVHNEWRDSFYPADLPDELWFEHYARYFPAVELDSTFYAAPPPDAVLRWAESTPASFRFTCKLPCSITHACGLRDCTAEFNAFLRAMDPLGAKLQVILIQLPPTFSPKEGGKSALESFLGQLPRDFRFAIDFRHPGWHRPQVVHLLERNRVCWAWCDTSPLNERNLAPFAFWPNTTDFLYVRLLGDITTRYDGDGQRLHTYGRLIWKREAAIESWALKIDRHVKEARSVWVFVNNHYEGYAPETCQRLAEKLGYELPLPSLVETASAAPGQLDLFRPA
ncbi:MAG: DUF72 domain-containing protein [Verrucomicrobiota bacterium]|nr:DUF72 domain-containing protein [Verrucomicrobiota bacterium]